MISQTCGSSARVFVRKGFRAMVLGALGTLAADAVSHIAGESPVVNAEKEFDRFMKSYEFAIEAQKLKREDIRNLMELIVDRMDMYHLIGALLLEFCIAFYGDFKLLEENYSHEPRLIMEIFLLSNIAAVGFLLFAIWLSLHASVAAHAIGVELLLDHNRLTIPTPENLRQMRQATSIFRSVYRMFDNPLRRTNPDRLTEDKPELEDPPAVLSLDSLEVGAGHEVLPPRLSSALHKLEHREKFAESHKSWLRFDAYSRVSMSLGINQMLQSLSYFILGPIQKYRPSFALISVVGIQAIAFFLLKLDLRTTDHGNYDEEDEERDNRDISRIQWGELSIITITFVLPPVWMVVVLWTCHFMGEGGRSYARVATTPIFFLHGFWLFLVWFNIKPHENDNLPTRLRTVGYLDVFTRDAFLGKDEEEEQEEEQAASKMRWRQGYKALRAGSSLFCSSHDEDRRGGATSDDEEIVGTVSTKKMVRTPRAWNRMSVTFHSGCGRLSSDERRRAKKKMLGHDHVAWLVVGRFTLSLIALWVIGGFIHIVHCTFDVEGVQNNLDGETEVAEESGEATETSPMVKELELLNKRRQLRADWPEPRSFFEVTALQCNASDLVVSSPFSSYVAELHQDEGAVGPLSPVAGLGLAAVLCGFGPSCEGLAQVRNGSWHLVQLAGSPGVLPGRSEILPIPSNWRIVTAARVPCSSATCHAVLLAGWDGHRVVIADLLRASPSASWELHLRFTVHDGLGSCRAKRRDAQDAISGREGRFQEVGYPDIRALHLHTTAAGCRKLAVLHGGPLAAQVDGWDLASGEHLGCWRAASQSKYSALCHDGRTMLLARHGAQGPVLESLAVPDALGRCGRSGTQAATQTV
eukprot:TRINITY_DN460_c0_g1_i9.p1 TRINITY_DN460_c0_g1~~TRINITY_DN460_c0_g1_i9.p1  ORF type:complete len:865 (-),score=131.31 TRINITY_DN460_c0_g1_i9:775-3369(-)